MLTDSLDIAMQVEDPEAGRIATEALAKGYQPAFENARGPFLEVQFVASEGSGCGAATSDGDGNEDARTLPRLYGWVEKVPTDAVIQVLSSSAPLCPTERSGAAAGTSSSHGRGGHNLAREDASRPSPPQPAASHTPTSAVGTSAVVAAQVCSEVKFLLHLWSTPHAVRAAQAPQDPVRLDNIIGVRDNLDERHDTSCQTSSSGQRRTDNLTEGAAVDGKRNVGDDVMFNARGERVVLTDPHERELERRDDSAMIRAAMDTIVTVGRMLKERPGARVSGYHDEDTGMDVITFT